MSLPSRGDAGCGSGAGEPLSVLGTSPAVPIGPLLVAAGDPG